MNIENVMSQLEQLGTEQTKKTFMRHGASEPLFGVKIGDLKKLVKYVKKDQDLALALYDTGNSDAMYLAGLSINPKLMTKEQLQDWMNKTNWHGITETIVAGVAAESPFALELARDWISSDDELVCACGWSTYTNYLSITDDSNIDVDEVRELLRYIEKNIHIKKNRVRYCMNQFVIGAGAFVASLYEESYCVAEKIGKVQVDVGNTACKVPLATDYLTKMESKGYIGKKKKKCIC